MRRALCLALALGLGASACAGSRPASPPAASPAASSSATEPAPTRVGVSRTTVTQVVSEGLGAFLRFIELDDHPVMIDGKFHGFRIAALHAPVFSDTVDLRPGDVVTAVNGAPVERPEQAQAIFESLGQAREIRVAYERDGKARELVVPIYDEP